MSPTPCACGFLRFDNFAPLIMKFSDFPKLSRIGWRQTAGKLIQVKSFSQLRR